MAICSIFLSVQIDIDSTDLSIDLFKLRSTVIYKYPFINIKGSMYEWNQALSLWIGEQV